MCRLKVSDCGQLTSIQCIATYLEYVQVAVYLNQTCITIIRLMIGTCTFYYDIVSSVRVSGGSSVATAAVNNLAGFLQSALLKENSSEDFEFVE